MMSPNINKIDSSKLTINHTESTELSQYQRFHENINLDAVNNDTNDSESDDNLINSDCEDPFIVEKIIKKKYNSHKVQYEYFMKWVGYAESENSWEALKYRLLNKIYYVYSHKVCQPNEKD